MKPTNTGCSVCSGRGCPTREQAIVHLTHRIQDAPSKKWSTYDRACVEKLLHKIDRERLA